MAEEFTEEYFEARISELKEQIEGVRPTLESSESFQAHNDIAQVQWNAQAAVLQSLIDKNKAPNGDKNKYKQIESEKRKELENTLKETWPDRCDKGDAIFGELDLSEIEKAILECAILVRSEPKRLAEWCAEKGEHRDLWKAFMENVDLQKKMILNGGAALGLYHNTVQIHADITQNFDNDAPNEVFDKIAMAIALEHAAPISVWKHPEQIIDPVERFWHYANAHTYNMLDKHFAGLTVWEMRNVVNCDATNEDLTWIREMLKAYRPDQVRTPCPKWKYLWSQRTDTASRNSMHSFENYPDLVSAGGACGPQAWYGRALCRAFGLPAWGVRQPGHAAIARWYPEGCWGTELGYAWIWSHFSELRYYKQQHERQGLDFNEDSRGRINSSEEDYYASVALLEALADCVGEWLVEYTPAEQIWRSLAISRRYRFASSDWKEEPKEWKNKPLKWKRPLLPSTPPKFSTDEKIEMKRNQWVIPAAVISSPDLDTFGVYHEFKDTEFRYYPGPNYRAGQINIMTCWTGGTQISFGKGNYWWEYSLPEDMEEGEYGLSCKFVNVHRTQAPLLFVVVDPDGTESVKREIDIPYTRGVWKKADHVMVDLKPGSKLKFNRGNGSFNLAIKEFYLRPSDKVAEE